MKKAPEELSLCQNLCAFIEEHLDEDLSLDCLSTEFYVSKYHISLKECQDMQLIHYDDSTE